MCNDKNSIESEISINHKKSLSKSEKIARLQETIYNINCSIRWNKKYNLYSGENDRLKAIRQQKIEELNELINS